MTLAANYGKLPLSFEANQGQTDSQVRFLSHGLGYSIFFTPREAVLSLTKVVPREHPRRTGGRPSLVRPEAAGKTDIVRMQLFGANPGVEVTGAEPLPGKVNYLLGVDASKWHTNVPTFSEVKYKSVYPGIDLVYYGNQQQLEYDFVVAPGADPRRVRLRFAGAERLGINREGDLTVSAENGAIEFHKPVVYQVKDGQRQLVESRFTLAADHCIKFALGSYDHSRELVIDPVLVYSTYISGNLSPVGNGGYAFGLAVDKDGSAYLTGYLYSFDKFPITPNAYQPLPFLPGLQRSSTGFITKLNPAGSAVTYSTYFGADAQPVAIAVDKSGSTYITGSTSPDGIPVTPGAYQPIAKQSYYQSGFVTKFNATGSAVIYSTYLSGSLQDYDNAISVDDEGSVYVAGQTFSPDYPVTPGAFQTVKKSRSFPNEYADGFLTKLAPDGKSLIYSTFLGGSGNHRAYTGDSVYALALDSSGSAYVTGASVSSDFPTTPGAFQRKNKHQNTFGSNAFVTKFNPSGSALVYSTYLGGSGSTKDEFLSDSGSGIAIDGSGNAYISGSTASADFPVTPGAFQTVSANGSDTAFVSKLNSEGTSLVYSTFLGGSISDTAAGIGIDPKRDVFVAGATQSADFPVTPDAFQTVNNGSPYTPNAFVAELNTAGSAVIYATFLGTYYAGTTTSRTDALGNFYILGEGTVPVTPGAYQTGSGTAYGHPGSSFDGSFAAKFAFNGITTTALTSSTNPQAPGEDVTFTAKVAPETGAAVPAGVVNFLVDGRSQAVVTLDSAGQASFTTRNLAVGPRKVTASYRGDPARYSASNDTLLQAISGQLPAPKFTKWPGTYMQSYSGKIPEPKGKAIGIVSEVPGAAIYYTTDGTTPTTASDQFYGRLTIRSSTTVKAIAAADGYEPSPVATAKYIIDDQLGGPGGVINVVSSANPSRAGHRVTFTFSLQAPQFAILPSVVFLSGGKVLGTEPLIKGAVDRGYATFTASYSTSALTPGLHHVIAIFPGNEYSLLYNTPVLYQAVR